MNIAQIEINLQKLIATFNKQTFINNLPLVYGLPKASITRLKNANTVRLLKAMKNDWGIYSNCMRK